MMRERFLKTFLYALGARQIIWTARDENAIFGTVFYDETNIEDGQDFVWHMTENDVPNDKVLYLLEYLTEKSLLDGDMLKFSISEIEIPNLDNVSKSKLFDELFRVTVNIIEDSIETDYLFIHGR